MEIPLGKTWSTATSVIAIGGDKGEGFGANACASVLREPERKPNQSILTLYSHRYSSSRHSVLDQYRQSSDCLKAFHLAYFKGKHANKTNFTVHTEHPIACMEASKMRAHMPNFTAVVIISKVSIISNSRALKEIIMSVRMINCGRSRP